MLLKSVEEAEFVYKFSASLDDFGVDLDKCCLTYPERRLGLAHKNIEGISQGIWHSLLVSRRLLSYQHGNERKFPNKDQEGPKNERFFFGHLRRS